MGLSYAGVDLSPLTPDEFRILEQWWIREGLDLSNFPGYTTIGINSLPIPDRPRLQTPIPLNTLVWPSCASRWGYMVTIVAGGNAQQIEAAVNQPMPDFTGTFPTPQPLVISDETTGLSITTEMYMVLLRPLFIQTLGRQYWLLYLVDERYYWWYDSVNVDDPTTTGWINPGLWTPGILWPQFLQNLINATNISIVPPNRPVTIPPINKAYTSFNFPGTIGPSERWYQASQAIPLMIDAAARSVGFRFVRNLDGSLVFINALNAISQDQTQFNNLTPHLVLGGRVTIPEIVGTIPQNVRIVLLITNGSFNFSLFDLITFAVSPLSPLYGTDINPATGGVPGYMGYVVGDFTGPPNITDGDLDRFEYCVQAGADYYNGLLSLTDATFRSIQPLVPTGMEDRLEWEYMPGRQNFHLAEPLDTVINPNRKKLPWERIISRIVRRDTADNNQYGTWIQPAVYDSMDFGQFPLGTFPLTPVFGTHYYTAPTGAPGLTQLIVLAGTYSLSLSVSLTAEVATSGTVPPDGTGLVSLWLEQSIIPPNPPGGALGWAVIAGSLVTFSPFDFVNVIQEPNVSVVNICVNLQVAQPAMVRIGFGVLNGVSTPWNISSVTPVAPPGAGGGTNSLVRYGTVLEISRDGAATA